MKRNSNCTKIVRHSRVKVEERGRKAVFINEAQERYAISRVDGCLIDRGTTSADFIVSKVNAVSILIELKGSDVEHACEQLFATVSHENVRSLLEGKIGFLVVCNRVPRFDGFVVRAKQKSAKKFKAGFHIVTENREFVIERVSAIDGPS